MVKTLEKKGGILLLNGFDVSKPGEYISDNASPSNQNFLVDRSILTKRNGTTAFPSAGTAIGGTEKEIMRGIQFTREGVDFNVRIGLDKIEKFNSGTDVWDDATGSDLTGTTSDLISTAIPTLSGKRILCFTNGIDNIRKYTGSGNTADLGGSPDKAKFMQEYRNYTVLANITGGVDIAQQIQWSDTADPENWSTGNSGAQILIEDGEAITGLNIFGSYLCVHKSCSIYLGRLVSSSDIFRFDRVATQVGTVADNSIQNLPTGEQIFLSTDGLRLFNGTSAPLIPSPVNDEIRDELATAFASKSWSVLVREEDEVWVAVALGNQTTPDTVYKYNYVTRVLYKDTRSSITAAWRFTNSSTLDWDSTLGSWDSQTESWNSGASLTSFTFIMFGSLLGVTTQNDPGVNNDNGVAVNAFFETKDFQLAQQRMGRWLELELWAKGNTVKIEYSSDAGVTWNEITSSPFTLNSAFPKDDSPDIFYLDEWKTMMRFRFSNAVLGEALQIKQFIVGVKPMGLRV